MTGFLPQEVIGCPVFEFFAEDDTNQLRELLRMTTKTDEKIVSPILNIQTVNHSPISVRVVLSVFKNPLTSELEHTLLDITAVASFTKSTATPSMDAGGPCKVSPAPTAHETESIADSSTNSRAGSYEGEEDLRTEASRAVLMNFLGQDGGLGNQDGGNLGWPFS